MSAMRVDFDDIPDKGAPFLADLATYTARGFTALNPEVQKDENPFEEAVKVLESDPQDYSLTEKYRENRVADYLFENPDEVLESYEYLATELGSVDPNPGAKKLAEGFMDAIYTMAQQGVHNPGNREDSLASGA